MSKRVKGPTAVDDVVEFVLSVETILARIKADIDCAKTAGIKEVVLGHAPTRIKATDALLSVQGAIAEAVTRAISEKGKDKIVKRNGR